MSAPPTSKTQIAYDPYPTLDCLLLPSFRSSIYVCTQICPMYALNVQYTPQCLKLRCLNIFGLSNSLLRSPNETPDRLHVWCDAVRQRSPNGKRSLQHGVAPTNETRSAMHVGSQAVIIGNVRDLMIY